MSKTTKQSAQWFGMKLIWMTREKLCIFCNFFLGIPVGLEWLAAYMWLPHVYTGIWSDRIVRAKRFRCVENISLKQYTSKVCMAHPCAAWLYRHSNMIMIIAYYADALLTAMMPNKRNGGRHIRYHPRNWVKQPNASDIPFPLPHVYY